jgi:hypothetical protein
MIRHQNQYLGLTVDSEIIIIVIIIRLLMSPLLEYRWANSLHVGLVARNDCKWGLTCLTKHGGSLDKK